MGVLSKGTDFSNGDQVTDTNLDNLVDNATFTSSAVDDATTTISGAGAIIIKDGAVGAANVTATGSTSSRSVSDRFADMVSVKDFGAVGDGVTDDTVAIQAAIDSGNDLDFPSGVYCVIELNFNQSNRVYNFNGATIKGVASSSTDAVVNFDTIRHVTFNDLRVNQNFNVNYTSAIHWYCSNIGSASPSQYVTINSLRVYNATIGLLFGQLLGSTDDPVYFSENKINDFVSRGTEVPIYMNQPLGWLFLNNPVIDANRNEWSAVTRPNFETDSRAIKLYYGSLQVNGGQLNKTQTNLGNLVDCAGQLQITGSYLEIACDGFVFDNETSKAGFTQECSVGMGNVKCNLLNNQTMFELGAATSGDLRVSGSFLQRSDGNAVSTIPLVNHNGVTDWVVGLSNTYLPNYRASNYISNYTAGGTYNDWDMTFLASQCRLGSDSYGWTTLETSVKSGSNANGHFMETSDGTKYCWIRSLSQTVDINIAVDNGFRSSVGSTASAWTLPITFTDTSSMVATGTVEGVDDIRIQFVKIDSASELRVQYHSNNSYTAKSVAVNLLVIGK